MGVGSVQLFGNQLVAVKSDASQTIFNPTGGSVYYSVSNTTNLDHIKVIGHDTLSIVYKNGASQPAYYTGNNIWYADPTFTAGDPVFGLVDTISPGHHITNPGGTIDDGWTWHIVNEGNRGGDDWNYSYGTNFAAPGPGVVDHFDVAGVGMVVRLTLTTPATRINAEQAAGYDQYGPMSSIHFEHCAGSVDGPCSEGDIIGQSGDGYGAYPAHLHVHGQINESSPSSSANRCCFWGFV